MVRGSERVIDNPLFHEDGVLHMNAAAAELLGTPPRRRMIEWVPYSRHNHGTEHSSRHLQLKGSCENAENEHGNTICYDYKRGLFLSFMGLLMDVCEY
ncbi:hypothetical protein CDAR_379311 [Caerostris darwini]|uniref:Uncharacterized protein n=1 Tax=Caerostris darwini TaxID=1538125 RepID=A0AAV4WJR7_9ARAC|nr:hypothetical protein CDAR_379311 [Caerostris darwini]